MRAPTLAVALLPLLLAETPRASSEPAAAGAAERVVLPTVDISPMGGRETWPIAPGQMRRHQIDLQAGEFLQATVEQEGVDVALRTVSALGVPRDFDVSDGPRGREPASILASSPGRYAIEVEVPEHGRGLASYSIVFESVQPATDVDRARLVAELAIQEGARYMGGRAADSKRVRPTYLEVMTARAWFLKALPFYEARRETCWQAELEANLALFNTWGNALDPEGDDFPKVLDLWEACGDERKFDESLLWAGRWYQVSNRYENAASVFDLGLRRVRERGEDRHLELQHLVGLATVRGLLGETSESIALNEEALPLLRGLGIRHGEAVTLEGLARAYYRQGALQPAAELAVQSARLRIAVSDQYNAIGTLQLAAEIQEALGEPGQALRFYDEAAAVSLDVDSGGTMAIVTRAAAADVLRQLGRRDLAVERLSRAIALADLYGAAQAHAVAETAARISLGRLYADESAWDQAGPHIERALALVERSGDRYAQATVLELRGRLHRARGDVAAARTDLSSALERRRAIGDRIGEASSLYELSRLDVASGDMASARTRLEDARGIVRAQRVLIVSPALRATWLATVRRIDEAYVDLLSGTGEPSDRARAFDASEAAHARVLLEMLGESHAVPAEGADPALRARERSLRERLTDRIDRRMRSTTDDEAAQAEIRDLAAEHERARAALRATSPRYAALADPEPMRAAEIQRDLLDGDTVLLEYFLGTERSRAWLVTKDSLRAYDLAPRSQIDQAVEAVRRALERRPSAANGGVASRELRALAALVVDPLAADLRGQRLVVVPDGSLHHVPFAALTDRTAQPLLGRFEVVNAPSASVVAVQRREQRERPTPTRAVAVLADPVFDGRDERIVTGSPSPSAPSPTLARLTRGFGFRDGRLPRLPFTRREARAILAVAPAAESRVSLDFGASLAAVRDPDLASYRYLHFATHGLLDDARPELSGIVLSLVDRKGREQTGLLTAPEVMGLRLGADLVVLSSCRSALGREVHGEGLLGLTRAFMYAGAPRVVASLWPVDDLATAELMQRFYRGMLGPERLTAAAALRQAQQDLRRQPQWRAPYYWAGFQIQGEWR